MKITRLTILLLLLLTLHWGGGLYASSPYIYRVYEYRPAPGQFINLLPEYEAGDDANMMRLKAEEAIADNNLGMVSLGGWGGYITFGFDHVVKNVHGQNDFIILGNAFYSETHSDESTRQGGSAEPGIIWVSYDSNGNGKPDDEWYELAGSEYGNKSTITDYQLIYYRPDADHVATPSKTNKSLTDTTYIRWTDNHGMKGYMNQLVYHLQSYFPNWISDESLTFTGSRLPDNYTNEGEDTPYYVLYPYAYGYADNHPNTSEKAELNIDWAVTKDGQPANLSGIHFVRVYTGVHQQCGWLGETSTEITGAVDLHFATDLEQTDMDENTQEVYTITGTPCGKSIPDQQGVYILRRGQKTKKIMVL